MNWRKWLAVLSVSAAVFLSACGETATAENYFDQAVLNTNQINSSASRYFNRVEQHRQNGQLKVYDEQNKQMVPTDSVEAYVKQNNTYFKQNVDKVEKLPETDETRAMLQQSLAVFRGAYDVYEQDYLDIARKIDAGAPKAEIDAAIQAADAKLQAVGEERSKLIELAKPYAEKHKINVKW
ncbi:MAG: hypothetical protein Q4G28_02330 [Neisseria sp.]|nr:hypothetical protein [Neisseria sp.]